MPQDPVPAFGSTLRSFRFSLPARLAVLGAALFAEKIVLSALIDERRAREAAGLGEFLRVAQHWGLRFLVTFVAAASVFAFVKARQVRDLREGVLRLPDVSVRWLLAHALLFATLAWFSSLLFRSEVGTLGLAALVGLWLIICTSAVIAAGVALLPVEMWLRGIRSIGMGWSYAAVAALVGTGAWLASENLWNSATAITFHMVTWVLVPILWLSYVNPATHVIATPRFAIEITDYCSGLEGLGLMVAFSVMWLTFFRREYIFPRALILIPLSLAAIFCLNVLRIAALLLIGDAGYPNVASFGFHSQAGWIAFNVVAGALVFFSRRSPWLNRKAIGANGSSDIHNPTATYLVPLLSILAAGTLSHALSGQFETLYPLRLVAAMAALWAFRRQLLSMHWRWTWRAPAIGSGVFLLWLAAAQWLLPASTQPDPLLVMMRLPRILWIACHCLTSIVFVPIAEELAYRGYLMRRFINSDFEAVSNRAVPWSAVIGAGAAFGVAHGALWSAGIVAGVAYGLLVTRRGSLGEAVVAHATTNGLIAIAVVAGNQWQLW